MAGGFVAALHLYCLVNSYLMYFRPLTYIMMANRKESVYGDEWKGPVETGGAEDSARDRGTGGGAADCARGGIGAGRGRSAQRPRHGGRAGHRQPRHQRSAQLPESGGRAVRGGLRRAQ